MSYLTEEKALKYVTSPHVKQRVRIERQIAMSLVNELVEQGFEITIDNGGGEDDLAIKRSKDVNAILDAMWETDEEWIYVFRSGDADDDSFGWLYLVYGNDGWDVLSDYTTNLEPFIPKTNKLIDSFS